MTELKALLQKYDLPAPRYTSYPTVPVWTEGVGAADYAASLGQLKPGDKLSLYFHLPFCERLCHFCGCMRVITSDRGRSAAYVRILKREIELVSARIPGDLEVTQLHFGGGTPNFLQPEELSELMRAIRARFRFSPEAEIAIEMHPRTSTPAFCAKLKELGFNRISLGVQDFDPQVQKLIHRDQSYEVTAEMLEGLRKLGFDSFNFDLIYGLPGQSLKTWQHTLEQVVGLKPHRLAVYSYAHVPWKSPVQRSFQDSDLPSPELKLQLFAEAYERFLASGYRLIGMDHFALADDELSRALDRGDIHRNFMGYTTRAEAHQLGFGVSAIAFVAGNYFQNLKELSDYERAIASGDLAGFRGFRLSADDRLRRELIGSWMCRGFIDTARWGERHGIDFQSYFAAELGDLTSLIEDGLIRWDGRILQATELGQLFLRIVAMRFDRYLPGLQKESGPIFSRSV